MSQFQAFRQILPAWTLSGKERLLLATVCGLLAFHIVWVERQAAFKVVPKSALNCYLRAAWAVRSGEDLYQVTDSQGWHYNYPPLTAILMTPMALPPTGQAGAHLPFSISVAGWYSFSVLCIASVVYVLANALERAAPQLRIDTTLQADRARWLWLCAVPVIVCLPAIVTDLMWGQMEGLVLGVVGAAIVATIYRRNFQAGLWLGIAITIKMFPALLLVYPLWRRDYRCLAGAVSGLLLAVVAIPMLAFGPSLTVSYYREFAHVMVMPALGSVPEDHSRLKELTSMEVANSQSLLTSIHNMAHISTPREIRPLHASAAVVGAARGAGFVLLLATLYAARWRRRDSAIQIALFYGTLTAVMLLAAPISHSYYYGLLVPLVMAILADEWSRYQKIRLGPMVVLLVYLAAGMSEAMGIADQHIRDLGIPMAATVALWLLGVIALRSTKVVKRESVGAAHVPVLAMAA